MADYLTTDTELASIADAIRTKGGTSASLEYPDEFISAINAITTSGTYQSKSVSPTESQQTVSPDTGYDALSSVTVGAISTTYVGSGIARKSSTDLTASGATVTASAGYYSSAASKSVASGSATTPATTVTADPSISVGSDGLITSTVSATKSVTPTVSAGYVSSGTAGTITVSGSNTSQLTVQAAQTITPTTTDQTITSGKYLTGTQTIKGDANLVAANIAKDVVIFGVTGTHEGGGGGYVTQDANGYIVLPSTGSGSGGGSATQHTIHLEFSDSSDTDVAVYYDNSLIGTMITAYEPSTWTYNNKTVTLAQLDNVTWYDKQSIPIGVELIDYNECLDDYAIDSSGNAIAQQWYVASDYTAIESGMTFSFKGCRWYYLAYYDSSKAVISAVYIDNISTPDSNDSNVGVGTLSTGIPANAKYIRITGTGAMSSRLSLIRTA